jgi:hypothetical protein
LSVVFIAFFVRRWLPWRVGLQSYGLHRGGESVALAIGQSVTESLKVSPNSKS